MIEKLDVCLKLCLILDPSEPDLTKHNTCLASHKHTHIAKPGLCHNTHLISVAQLALNFHTITLYLK